MLKVIMLLARHEDLGQEAFARRLREAHLPLVAALPGLRRLTAGEVLPPPAGPAVAWDAMLELWFDDLAAVEAAFTTPEAQAVTTDAPEFQDMAAYRQFVVQEAAVAPDAAIEGG